MANLQETLAIFRNGSALLTRSLEDLTDAESTIAPPGKWNVRQIVRHVADTEIVVGMRLRHIIAEDSPTLIPFDQEAWAERLGYETADPFDSLARFVSLRDDTARLLDGLPDEDFERPGVHPERGTKTLLEWVRIFGVHVQTHAKQIEALRVGFTT
jgi:hypothetical protein